MPFRQASKGHRIHSELILSCVVSARSVTSVTFIFQRHSQHEFRSSAHIWNGHRTKVAKEFRANPVLMLACLATREQFSLAGKPFTLSTTTSHQKVSSR